MTILTDGKATVMGLEIAVTENTEKRDMNGRDFMRVSLHVRDAGGEGEVHLSTERVEATWGSWRFVYLGGWRKDVHLEVQSSPAAERC